MVDEYFPENTVMVTGYGFDMLYAGPREALFARGFPAEHGCNPPDRRSRSRGRRQLSTDRSTHRLCSKRFRADALEIDIFAADHTAWSKKLGRVVMMREAADHSPEDFVLFSGTRVSEMLEQGIAPPAEFSRPEVAQILIEHYRREGGQSAA